ncbi:MAG: hypothetical protein EOP86_28315 [Verrucomicrobiaceae bacterium]|nr:MAG: hypothetical protein EOP86_28315 [Verrucomicrobiaceae bacterium]
MKPDPASPSGPDPEALLRGLRHRPLPENWRAGILAAAHAANAAAEPDSHACAPAVDALPFRPGFLRSWLRRPLVRGLAAAWTLIAALRLTTPAPSVPTAGQLAALRTPYRPMEPSMALQLAASFNTDRSSLSSSLQP